MCLVVVSNLDAEWKIFPRKFEVGCLSSESSVISPIPARRLELLAMALYGKRSLVAGQARYRQVHTAGGALP